MELFNVITRLAFGATVIFATLVVLLRRFVDLY